VSRQQKHVHSAHTWLVEGIQQIRLLGNHPTSHVQICQAIEPLQANNINYTDAADWNFLLLESAEKPSSKFSAKQLACITVAGREPYKN